MKGLCGLLLASLTLLVGCGGERGDTRRAPAAGGCLVLATTLGSEPYAYLDDSGAFVGIDIDIARAAAARMGCSLEIRPMPFARLLPSVKSGEADFAASAIAITPGRARDVDFTDAYAFDGASFIYRAGAPRPTVSRGNVMRVGTPVASMNQFFLSDHGIDSVAYADFADAFADLKRGKLDAVFYDAVTIREAVRQSNGAYLMTPLFTRESFGVAVRKDFPRLKEELNAVIRARKEAK